MEMGVFHPKFYQGESKQHRGNMFSLIFSSKTLSFPRKRVFFGEICGMPFSFSNFGQKFTIF
jgi:hypothetical protein